MRISKSNYLIGRQCSRRLWLAKRDIEPVIESEDIWEMRELESAAVERLVESLFINPVRIAVYPDKQSDEALPDADVLADRTREALLQGRPVFQAYLQTEKLLAIVDILEPQNGAWYLWEVKASTSVVPMHDHDLAFQVEVATQTGLDVAGAGVRLVNKDYVRGVDLEPTRLLQSVDRTTEVFKLAGDTQTEISRQLDVIRSSSIPSATPSPRCRANRKAKAGDRPSDCGHLGDSGHCGKTLPKNWNGRLPNLSGKKAKTLTEFENPSIEALDLDDEEIAWTELQRRMIQAVQSGKPFVDPEALRVELDKLEWPIAYIDFEFDPGMAVPRFAGTWPYARVPFQWSMHIQRCAGAELEQPDPFIWLESTDPRQPFLDALLGALPESGSIVVHSKTAELTVLRELGRSLGGDYTTHIEAIETRLFDTIDLLKAGYYHPDQQGSYSIKKVGPALVGRGYKDLEIHDGMAAVVSWKKAIDPATEPRVKAELERELLEYCGRDTTLLHDVVESLRDLSCP